MVSLRDKPLRAAGVLFAVALAGAAACAGSVSEPPRPPSAEEVALQYADQQVIGDEEVLHDPFEEDEFGRPKKGGADQAGEFLVAVGYVGMILASIVLPLLAL